MGATLRGSATGEIPQVTLLNGKDSTAIRGSATEPSLAKVFMVQRSCCPSPRARAEAIIKPPSSVRSRRGELTGVAPPSRVKRRAISTFPPASSQATKGARFW